MTVTELPTPYQGQIFRAHYARWREEDKRRETWPEAVDRYLSHVVVKQAQKHDYEVPEDLLQEIRQEMLDLELVGSMRALATAGPALDRDNIAGYNCVYLAINRTQAFDETLLLLACGCGVGFSVERQFVNQLPTVPEELYPSDTTIVVTDSKIGWASSLRQLINLLYSGVVPKWDTSRVRPAGTPLKTMGGRASGPGPLEELFRYVIATFQNAVGRKLYSIECHGIECKIGTAIISAGKRRSALLSMSNPSDDRMRDAKSGNWQDIHPEFALANNSAAWTEKPDAERFLGEWLALVKSHSGERGIIYREGMKKQVGRNGRRNTDHEFGTNPCCEIILRDREACNLSEVVLRPHDTFARVARKVELTTILGTIQSTLTDFRYLSPAFKRNCEEERLLGVSLTGVMDHPVFANVLAPDQKFLADSGLTPDDGLRGVLESLKALAVRTNEIVAQRLGIPPSAAITCIKPSGTTSQLVYSAPGMHTWWAEFMKRTVRLSKHDPVAQLMESLGVPCEDEIMNPNGTWVFSFPLRAPKGAMTRKSLSAVEQLELWLLYAEHWCEHKPSMTVYVKDHEWVEAGAFVHKNFDRMSGISFLPAEAASVIYQQAPYQEVTPEEYETMVKEMPPIDWSRLSEFEQEDNTTGSRELSCIAGACEV